ncbi:MAG: hypothetical protein ACP5EP_10655 [Acidobacteriaceae bacterium]
MNNNVKTLLFAAAVSGLFTGTALRANAATPAEGAVAEGSHAPYTTQTATGSTSFLYTGATTDKHSCKGKNSCKGKGADHKNSCKGKGSCATDGSKPLM